MIDAAPAVNLDQAAKFLEALAGSLDAVVIPSTARGRKWRAANPERARAAARRNGQSPAGKRASKRWRDKNLHWEKDLLGKARRTSKFRAQRGRAMPCTITILDISQIWEKQQGRCHWTGMQLDHQRHSPWIASLDRLDNKGGYTPDNVVITSWFVNRARGNMGAEEFCAALLKLKACL